MNASTPTPSIAAIVLGGFVALAVAVGIGRFAFTPVLPLMQEEYGVSVSDAGWLASSNYLGYLAGSLLASVVAMSPRVLLRAGLAATGAFTLAMAFTQSFPAWMVLRAAAGFASAFVFIAVSAWTLARLASLRRPLLNAAVFSGVGGGIAGAGLITIAGVHLGLHTREMWAVLGIAALVLCALAWRSTSGPEGGRAGATAERSVGHTWDPERIRLVLAYGFVGFGYIIPATFLPLMAKQLIPDPAVFAWSWPVFGLAAAASTMVLALMRPGADLRRAWIAAQVVMAAGVALPAISGAPWAIFASALSVGGTFMVVTAAAMQEARRVAPHQATALVAVMTSAFALGQIAGPIVVSALAGAHGCFSTALVSASVLLLVGAGLLVRRRPRDASGAFDVRRTEDVS